MRTCEHNRNKKGKVLFITLAILSMVMILYSSPAQALSKNDWLWPIPEHKHMSRGYYSDHKAIDIDAGYGTPVRAAKDGFVIRIYTGCTGNYNSYASCTRTTCAPTVYENFGAYSSADYRTYDGGIYGFEEKDTQGNVIHSWSRCNGGYGIGLLIYHPEDDSVSSYAHFSRLNPDLDLIEKIKNGTAKVKQGDIIGYVGASGNAFGAHLHFQIGYSYGNWVNNNPNSPSLGITSDRKTGLTTSSDGYSYNTDGVSYIFNVDKTPPVVSNIRISDLSNSGYTVVCDVSDNIGVTRVAFPTWTDADWQDDIIWQDGIVSGGTASFRVNISDHGNQTGKYLTYIYAYDAAGNISEENDTTRVSAYVDGIPPVVSNIRISDLSSSGYTVTCDVSDNIGVTRVAFPTWTDADWQDDIVWQDGILSEGTASFRVNISDHGNQTGKYLTYIYAYDAAGNISEENDSTRVYVNVTDQTEERHQLAYTVNAPWNGTLPPYRFPEYGVRGERINIHAVEEGSEYYYEGLVFDHWESNNGGVFDDPYEADTVFTMPDGDVTVCAVFRGEASYTLTVTATQGGYVSVIRSANNELLATVSDGTIVLTIAPETGLIIEAVANDRYGFSKWNCTDNHMSSSFSNFMCNMSYRNTTIEAVFKINPFAMEDNKTLHLPAGLQVIESEAFTDVGAVYFDVPSSVRSIGTNAFPHGAVVYIDTRWIEDLSGNVISESGVFIEKSSEYNYEFASSLENTSYHYYNACGEVPE